MSPVSVGVFVCFLLSQFAMLHSDEKEKELLQKCPHFYCGTLGPIRFPFIQYRNVSNYTCGFLPVDCSNQSIQLEERGNWYKIFSISQDTILIQDEELTRKILKKDCNIFNNISYPNSPSVSFNILLQHNITLYKCGSHANDSTCSHANGSMTDDSFFSYKGCKDFNIYYHKQLNDHHPICRPNCSVINLPVSKTKERTGDLFNLFYPKVFVEVMVSPDCRRCHFTGGLCEQDSKGKFDCANLRGMKSSFDPQIVHSPIPNNLLVNLDRYGKNKKALTLSVAIPGSVFVLGVVFLLIFITYKRHKRQKLESANFLSRRSDLERDSVYFGIPIFSYNDLVVATNTFDSSKELGDGGFGTVYYGKLQDGREVAVKRLYEKNYRRVEQFMNEIEILTRLRHRNLVSLYGCTSRTSRELILVYEFISNGTVADHIHGDRANSSALTWPLRMNIAIETANALVYLHASDIIHRDVKTNNILLDDNFHVKVADFGLSRLFPTDVTHVSTAPQGTPGYVDPEYHQCYQLTNKSDVYSFGVVLIELISSMPAIDINRHTDEINLSNYAINKIQNHAIDELIDPILGFQMDFKVRRMATLVAKLAFKCLQSEKEMRPLMDEVLKDLIRIESEEDYEVDTNEDELKGVRSSEYGEVTS